MMVACFSTSATETMSTITFLASDSPHHISRNLRGLKDYANKRAVVCVITRKRKRNEHERDPGGELTVVYSDGAIGRSEWASHAIMIDWVRNRRSWRYAQMRYLDGDYGYLTSPGRIADLPIRKK
jgi:hypothetical protein